MPEELVERRLVAILAADVVGYSRLMEKDEEKTLATLTAHRKELIEPCVADHRGRVVKTTGDGLLVEFSSVVDAVRCAIAFQDGIRQRNTDTPENRRVVFRIGVNLGDVIVQDSDVFGDGVNIAARLEGLAEPGGICISAKVYEEVSNKLGVTFEDLGPRGVKNISAPVHAYSVMPAGAPTEARSAAVPFSDKPSIAVLPFDNMSNDPEQEYFSDGIAEDVITDLSKISGLLVIARNSSFAFKGQAIGVKEIGERLGVKHILEGSVRKMGQKLRINAQLIDARSGGHLWAERYDGDLEDLFDFQDTIREQIVAALRIRLSPTERARADRKPTQSIEAYDLFLKGRANYYRYTTENLLEAIECLERAIEFDPKFADAFAYLSHCYFQGWVRMVSSFENGLQRAHELAETAVALDGTSAIALARLGWVQTFLRRYDDAVANLEKALALAPSNAEVFSTYGQILNWLGDPQRGLEMVEKALSIETFAPPNWEFQAGHSLSLLNQHEKAVARFLKAIERAPMFARAHTRLACEYVEMGRLDDANTAMKSALEITPCLTVEEMAKRSPYRSDEPRNRFLDNLRKAGLPEG